MLKQAEMRTDEVKGWHALPVCRGGSWSKYLYLKRRRRVLPLLRAYCKIYSEKFRVKISMVYWYRGCPSRHCLSPQTPISSIAALDSSSPRVQSLS